MTRPLYTAYACDHCRHHARVQVQADDSAQDIADRVEEAHAIAQTTCHAQHGAAGLRMNATTGDALLWEI